MFITDRVEKGIIVVDLVFDFNNNKKNNNKKKETQLYRHKVHIYIHHYYEKKRSKKFQDWIGRRVKHLYKSPSVQNEKNNNFLSITNIVEMKNSKINELCFLMLLYAVIRRTIWLGKAGKSKKTYRDIDVN